jgi:hypothetical protein
MADTDSAHKWGKNVTLIITQYAPKDTATKVETAQFYNAQLKRTLASKQEKCKLERGCEDRVTVLSCCDANNSEKNHRLKGLKHYLVTKYLLKIHG